MNLLLVFKTIGRLVTFQLTRDEFLRFDYSHLLTGLVCTWIVGIGRTLHNSRVEWWQHLGLGSVAYIFILSFLLWLLFLPLRIPDLSYRHILTFVSLTSPTGIIYAIPVERFMSLAAATETRAWFLGIVAAWRVALWVFYLMRFCRLGGFSTTIVSLLPLCLIVAALTTLNLDKVVFNIMLGMVDPSTDDSSYMALLVITVCSVYAFLPLLFLYLCIVVWRWQEKRAALKSL